LKILIFNFDGTDNEPSDAKQSIKKGKVEDDSISNILKFHLLCGGDLKEGNTPLTDGSRVLYYHGVGTYGHVFQRKFNALFAPNRGDVSCIINNALEDFKKYYEQEGGYQKILITGFSRGGAIARRFAALINNKVEGKIIIEGIFDTVASIGAPNLSQGDRPSSDVIFEDHTLPSNVEKAVHMVSLDDKRRAFQPTLMNQEDKVLEVWFAGAHSDIGGGYYYDALSDIVLQFFMDWVNELELGLQLLESSDINYHQLVDSGTEVMVTEEDVMLNGTALGKNHQQERKGLLEKVTLFNRRCVVVKDDQVTSDLPIVHWSVAEKILKDANYHPKSLEVAHQILFSDKSKQTFSDYEKHRL
jgi:uncharacterized protein (DUF2235 family)